MLRRTVLWGWAAAAAIKPSLGFGMHWQGAAPIVPSFQAPAKIAYGLADLVRLTPKLATFLSQRAMAAPSWRDIITAAPRLAADLGVSKGSWDAARLAVGNQSAALALVLVSRKPTPSAAFDQLILSVQQGAVNIDRLAWAATTS